MLRRLGARALLLGTTLALGCSTPVAADCDADAIRSALAIAAPGGRVTIGACTVAGPFVVRPGVTLEGTRSTSIIVGPNGGVGVTLQTGSSASRVSGVHITHIGGAAIVATGPGDATIDDVAIELTTGVGIGADNGGLLSIRHVDIDGPATPGASIPGSPSPRMFATHGIALVGVTHAQLETVSVTGVAHVGLLAYGSGVTWTGGGVSGSVGTGILASGGTLELAGVTIDGLEDDAGLGSIDAGLVTLDGAIVTSTSLHVTNGSGRGIIQLGGAGQHTGVVLTGNAGPGVHAQDGAMVSVTGPSMIADNGAAGIIALSVAGLDVTGATIARQRSIPQSITGGGTMAISDGLHISGLPALLSLRDLTVTDHARVGVLLDLGGTGTIDGSHVTNVSVSGTAAAALGVVAQHGTASVGWDSGVTRSPNLVTADAAFDWHISALSLVGLVTPSDLHGAVSAVEVMGLDGLVTPSD